MTIFIVTLDDKNQIQLFIKQKFCPSIISFIDSKPELFTQSCQNICEKAVLIGHLWKVKGGCINYSLMTTGHNILLPGRVKADLSF